MENIITQLIAAGILSPALVGAVLWNFYKRNRKEHDERHASLVKSLAKQSKTIEENENKNLAAITKVTEKLIGLSEKIVRQEERAQAIAKGLVDLEKAKENLITMTASNKAAWKVIDELSDKVNRLEDIILRSTKEVI